MIGQAIGHTSKCRSAVLCRLTPANLPNCWLRAGAVVGVILTVFPPHPTPDEAAHTGKQAAASEVASTTNPPFEPAIPASAITSPSDTVSKFPCPQNSPQEQVTQATAETPEAQSTQSASAPESVTSALESLQPHGKAELSEIKSGSFFKDEIYPVWEKMRSDPLPFIVSVALFRY